MLSDLIERFRASARRGLGDEAVKIGTRVGSDALGRIADQARQQPLLTLAVAIGVGILIGAASRRN